MGMPRTIASRRTQSAPPPTTAPDGRSGALSMSILVRPCATAATLVHNLVRTLVHALVRRHRQGMDHDDFDDDAYGPRPRGDARRPTELLTLALLEDLATVLHAHGFPPLSGYALVELTSSLYRLQ